MKSRNNVDRLSRHRAHQQRKGLRRIEMAVRAKDAALLKSIAATLRAEGPEADKLRVQLRELPAVQRPKSGADLLSILRAGTLFDDDVLPARQKSSRPPVIFS